MANGNSTIGTISRVTRSAIQPTPVGMLTAPILPMLVKKPIAAGTIAPEVNPSNAAVMPRAFL
jgi:hypothetical protein